MHEFEDITETDDTPPRSSIEPGAVYRNKSRGGVYQVFDFAKHSETLEKMVVYVAVEQPDIWHGMGLFFLWLASGFLTPGSIWVRPVELFREKFIKRNTSRGS